MLRKGIDFRNWRSRETPPIAESFPTSKSRPQKETNVIGIQYRVLSFQLNFRLSPRNQILLRPQHGDMISRKPHLNSKMANSDVPQGLGTPPTLINQPPALS